MRPDQMRLERRALLARGSALLAGAVAIPLLAWNRSEGAGESDRAALRYQDSPKSGRICADCWAYLPEIDASAGRCKVVAGMVSANGWCMAYSPKRDYTRPWAKPIAT